MAWLLRYQRLNPGLVKILTTCFIVFEGSEKNTLCQELSLCPRAGRKGMWNKLTPQNSISKARDWLCQEKHTHMCAHTCTISRGLSHTALSVRCWWKQPTAILNFFFPAVSLAHQSGSLRCTQLLAKMRPCIVVSQALYITKTRGTGILSPSLPIHSKFSTGLR